MSYDSYRCGVCNAADADEWADGTASCSNCGGILSNDDREPNVGPTPIYPLLVWAWAPCQRCGAGCREQYDPEDDSCPECGEVVVPIMLRAAADGFPTDDSKTHRPKDSVILVGDQGVWKVDAKQRLIPCDPFTLLEVTGIHADGDLDVVAVHHGAQWMKVPQRDFRRLYE